MVSTDRPPLPTKHLTCQHCGKEFDWVIKPAMTPIYCSGKCRRGACTLRQATPPPGSPTYICKICTKEFKATGKNPLYCDKKCKDKANQAAHRARKALKATPQPQTGAAQLQAIAEHIERKGGIQEWLNSGPEICGDQKRALERYALNLPYHLYEQCHRLMNRVIR